MTPRFHHVGIFVSDLDASVRFYCDVLEMEFVEREADGFAEMATLRMGEHEVHLFEPKGEDSAPRIEHAARWVSAAELEAKMAALKAAGVPFGGPYPYKDTRFIKLEDPDGLVWEYIAPAG